MQRVIGAAVTAGLVLLLAGAFLSLYTADPEGLAWRRQYPQCPVGKYAEGCALPRNAPQAPATPSASSPAPEASAVTSTAQSAASRSLLTVPATSSVARTSYLYAGKKLARFDGAQLEFFHDDHLGTASARTDNTGAIIETSRQLPFGQQIGSVSKETDFTGKKQDRGTGLDYFNARHYLATAGRFVEVDPAFEPGDALYAYVGNAPLTATDPTGLTKFVTNPSSHDWFLQRIMPQYEDIGQSGFRRLVEGLPPSRIRFAEMVNRGDDFWGFYHPPTRRVVLDIDVIHEEPSSVIRAVLGHEGAHAYDYASRRGVFHGIGLRTFLLPDKADWRKTLDREYYAYRVQARLEKAFGGAPTQELAVAASKGRTTFEEAMESSWYAARHAKTWKYAKWPLRLTPIVGTCAGIACAVSEARAGEHGRATLSFIGAFIDPVDWGVMLYDASAILDNNQPFEGRKYTPGLGAPMPAQPDEGTGWAKRR